MAKRQKPTFAKVDPVKPEANILDMLYRTLTENHVFYPLGRAPPVQLVRAFLDLIPADCGSLQVVFSG